MDTGIEATATKDGCKVTVEVDLSVRFFLANDGADRDQLLDRERHHLSSLAERVVEALAEANARGQSMNFILLVSAEPLTLPNVEMLHDLGEFLDQLSKQQPSESNHVEATFSVTEFGAFDSEDGTLRIDPPSSNDFII